MLQFSFLVLAVFHECQPSGQPSCPQNSFCKKIRDEYQCRCRPGFSGDGKTCRNINECTRNLHKCNSKENCVDTRGSYICQCKLGFSRVSSRCENRDECELGIHNCHKDAVCNDTNGSFQCRCKKKFAGSGTHCVGKVWERAGSLKEMLFSTAKVCNACTCLCLAQNRLHAACCLPRALGQK